MLNVCWRTFRRALPICLVYGLAFAASVTVGWGLAQADPVPPASAVTPAPSGSGQFGRAPRAPSLERTTPPTVRKTPPRTGRSEKPRHTYRSPSPMPSPSSRPTPEATTPPKPVTPEPSTPTVSPTP